MVQKEVRRAVAIVVRQTDGLILAVRRPDEPGEELPGLWGLPATTLRPAESPEEGVRRLGREKLRVDLTPLRPLAEGEQPRDGYTLRMTVYEASMAGAPSLPPRAPGAASTLYDAVDRLPAASFREAADRGSLCCRLFLEAQRPPAAPLPDYLRLGLDVVFVGINPGRWSAARGHHYAGPGNHFWPLLFEAGFVPEPLTYQDDWRAPQFGIGLTNLVDRPSRGSDDLSREELRAGARRLRDKLRRYRPRVVCCNAKLVYQAVAGHRCDFGLQPERLEGALAFVMPSTSPRTASYQRAEKLRFFQELKRIVDEAKGDG